MLILAEEICFRRRSQLSSQQRSLLQRAELPTLIMCLRIAQLSEKDSSFGTYSRKYMLCLVLSSNITISDLSNLHNYVKEISSTN